MKNLIVIIIFLIFSAVGAQEIHLGNKIKYRASFGSCPSKAAGSLTLKLVRAFEENFSLKNVKQVILEEKLVEKHFISKYSVSFDPIEDFLSFSFDCPDPLMKVQIYKAEGLESYDAILVESGELYDPTYEVLLRAEKKLNYDLPFLAIPVGEMNEEIQLRITELVAGMNLKFRMKLSEIIISEDRELTIILSISNQPTSVFLGTSRWPDKLLKLYRIVNYMEVRNKMPAIINLTNLKKVVVKFNDKT